jgi:hypothetical protein
MRALVVVAMACGTQAAPAPTPGGPLQVAPADRTCTADPDCTAILTLCSMCEGACTGVRLDRASQYDGRLDCKAYQGKMCNYDCRPEYKAEQPRCVSGRCESVRLH